MFYKKLLIATSLALAVAGSAHAADNVHHFNFNQGVANAVAAGAIDNSVKFSLAGAPTRPGKLIEAGIVTNQKTNGFGKSAETSCDWVLRSALIQLHKAAKARGGNAVVNITSYYRKNESRSSTTYECHKGAAIAGVALKGDIVRQ